MMKCIAFSLGLLLISSSLSAQESPQPRRKWGVELNLLWPIFPGNIYKGQVTYETWRNGELAGDVFAGLHLRPFEFREAEGDFANYALTFGYRQFLWKGLHLELYQAFGPGFNRNNASDGQDYTSWDYELGLSVGYRWEFLSKARRKTAKVSPYLSTQQGFYYLAAQSNPHPIIDQTAERPFYVGTLNLGVLF